MFRLLAGGLVLTALLVRTTALAQTDTVLVRNFKLHLKIGECVKGKDGVMTARGFSGLSTDGSKLIYPTSEVVNLKRRTGSQAGPCAVIGAGLGALISLTVTYENEETPLSQPDNSGRASKQVRLVAAGFFTGLCVGIFIPRWQEVRLPVQLGVTSSSDALGFKLAIRF